MSWKQDLVNAQVDINRAVFLMNVHFGGEIKALRHLDGESLSPTIVLKHIDQAIRDLEKAKTAFGER